MVILFDGVCNLCNGFVNFVMNRDPGARFRFGSLQSEAGRALVAKHGIPPETDSIVFIEDGRAFVRSTAVLRIVRRFSGLWGLSGIFLLIPSFLRDLIYDLVARNRYKLFGKRDFCRIPTAEEKARFID